MELHCMHQIHWTIINNWILPCRWRLRSVAHAYIRTVVAPLVCLCVLDRSTSTEPNFPSTHLNLRRQNEQHKTSSTRNCQSAVILIHNSSTTIASVYHRSDGRSLGCRIDRDVFLPFVPTFKMLRAQKTTKPNGLCGVEHTRTTIDRVLLFLLFHSLQIASIYLFKNLFPHCNIEHRVLIVSYLFAL